MTDKQPDALRLADVLEGVANAYGQVPICIKHGKADPFAYLRAIGGVQPFTDDEKTQLCLPVRMAYESLRSGRGDAGDFDTLAAVVNTCLIRAEQIAPELVARVIAAQDALMRIKERGQRTGRLGLDYQAMADLLPIIDLHEQLIDLSAPVQMRDALLEVMTRMNRGQILTKETS